MSFTSKDLLDEENKPQASPIEGGKRLMNDKTIYYLAITSFFLYIPVGTIMAIAALVRGNEELDEYKINPELYNHESYEYVRKGRMMGLISLIIQGVSIPLVIVLSIVLS